MNKLDCILVARQCFLHGAGGRHICHPALHHSIPSLVVWETFISPELVLQLSPFLVHGSTPIRYTSRGSHGIRPAPACVVRFSHWRPCHEPLPLAGAAGSPLDLPALGTYGLHFSYLLTTVCTYYILYVFITYTVDAACRRPRLLGTTSPSGPSSPMCISDTAAWVPPR
jgi:hypothetical protein